MVAAARNSHIGGCPSVADLLVVICFGFLNVDPAAPGSPERDRSVMSQGHMAAVLYATLAERDFFPVEELGERRRTDHPSNVGIR